MLLLSLDLVQRSYSDPAADSRDSGAGPAGGLLSAPPTSLHLTTGRLLPPHLPHLSQHLVKLTEFVLYLFV